MPRKLREEEAGAIRHVFARGVNRQPIFVDEHDYERYLRLLASTVKRQGWHCMSYCLMPNHVHLLLETPAPNLGAGMQWLHGLYGKGFNERHHRVGHVFQDRYRAEPIKDEVQFLTVVGYIALNPVAASLCRRPEHWRWSSHRATIARERPTWLAADRLMWRIGEGAGSHDYQKLVEARMRLTIDTTLK
jgi:putative transposase